jgi:copper chaperone CopZ
MMKLGIRMTVKKEHILMRKTNIVGLLLLALVLSVSVVGAATSSATVTIKIEGMHCDGCASSVEKKLKATEGVEEVRVSFPKKEAWVKYDDQKISIEKIHEVISSTGFKTVKE